MKAEDLDLESVIEELRGTCLNDLNNVLDQYDLSEDDLTADQLTEVDMEIFLCETCGWWYGRSEESIEEGYEEHCDTCADEEINQE